MAAVDKLLKYLNSKNIAEHLDDDEQEQIARDIITGYEIDNDSRREWLDTNKKAVALVKSATDSGGGKTFPFDNASQVVYPLLSYSGIQAAARMMQHLVRNDKVMECTVLGKDEPIVSMNPYLQAQMGMGGMPPGMESPQGPGMPPGMGSPQGPGMGQPPASSAFIFKYPKEEKARRVTDYANYQFLVESDSWLKDKHKLCTVVAFWGVGFTQNYYDPIENKYVCEFLPPEDVVINHNITSLDKAQRITIKHYLTTNGILENIRAGYFLDIDLDSLNQSLESEYQSDFRETHPIYEFLCQYCYIDLDGDDYKEPYKAYVHYQSKKLVSIVPAFEIDDINQEDGKIINIKPRFDIVDYHYMDDPEGKFYSIGMNYLLLQPNTAINTLERQLIDAGTAANTNCGFVTNQFKTKERTLSFQPNEYKVLDVNPTVNPQQHIFSLPSKEPSQALLSMLQGLIESSKEIGMITDVLTGDTQGQNVPATTMLAMIEQSTRAFKPVVQKLQSSLKKEFKIWFHINSKYLDKPKYVRFQDIEFEVTKDDFDEKSLDIVPVADPSQSSEAHKYAKIRALYELLQVPIIASQMNIQEIVGRIAKDLQIPNPERIPLPPAPPPPDPKLIKAQADQQKAMLEHQIDQMKLQQEAARTELEKMKIQLKSMEVKIKADESKEKQMKMRGDAMKDMAEARIKKEQLSVDKYNAITDRARLKIDGTKVKVDKYKVDSDRHVAKHKHKDSQ